MRNTPGGVSPGMVLALSLQCAATCLLAPVLLAPVASFAALPQAQASGVFINMDGDVLTARHAVTGCTTVYVIKNARVVRADVLAVDAGLDVAVLRTGIKPLLAATFSELPAPADYSIPVFSEAYAELQRLPDRARLLGNALTVPGQPGGLRMLSGARPGASGSAVLDDGALLLGIVVERVAGAVPGVAPGAPVDPALPRGQGMPAVATVVRAVPAAGIMSFLLRTGIPFTQSRQAQIGPQQSPASRAYTLAAGVICG